MKTRRSKTLFLLVYDHQDYAIYAYSGCHAYQILIRHLEDSGVPLDSIDVNDIHVSQLNTIFLK